MSVSAAAHGGCSCLRPSDLTISGVAWVGCHGISSEVLFKLAQQTMFDDFWDFWGVKMLLQSWMMEAYPLNFIYMYFSMKNGQQRPCLRDRPFAKLTEITIISATPPGPFFHALWIGAFKGNAAIILKRIGIWGRVALRNPASRQDLKNGRLLLGRSGLSAGWWSEDLGLGGMTIETEPSWNRWYFNRFHSSAQWSSYPEIISNNM